MNYSEFVAERFTKRHQGHDGLMHCAVCISGEAGELLDAIKKLWVYGKPHPSGYTDALAIARMDKVSA